MADLLGNIEWRNLLLKGDPKAISNFIDVYGGFIYNISYKILLNRYDAEEATQDTLMKILNAIQSYDQKSAFKAWCYTVAYRTAIDYKRKIRYTSPINPDIELSNNTEEADKKLTVDETHKSILALLSHLDEESRMIISLYYLEEKNIKELMEITGFTESNIKIKLFRSRKVLMQHAEKYKEHFKYSQNG